MNDITMQYDRIMTSIGINDNEFVGIDITHTETDIVFDYIVTCDGKVLYLN